MTLLGCTNNGLAGLLTSLVETSKAQRPTRNAYPKRIAIIGGK